MPLKHISTYGEGPIMFCVDIDAPYKTEKPQVLSACGRRLSHGLDKERISVNTVNLRVSVSSDAATEHDNSQVSQAMTPRRR